MDAIWNDKYTRIEVDGRGPFDFYKKVVAPVYGENSKESVFFIPAQRVLVLQDGWPSPTYRRSVEAPFCMREFSDILRGLLDRFSTNRTNVFPWSRLFGILGQLLDEAIYVGGKLKIEVNGGRKRLVLRPSGSKTSLSYCAWSAGQREFTPLMLGIDSLILEKNVIPWKVSIKTVVIEEPETGLHPQAIISFCLAALELLAVGFRVIISTHSPVVLDVIWALQEFRELPPPKAIKAMREIFNLRSRNSWSLSVLAQCMKMKYKVFYFDSTGGTGVHIRDISTLDPGDPDNNVSGWGGLSGFSGRIADIVGRAVEAKESR
jgi:hypothetical protein